MDSTDLEVFSYALQWLEQGHPVVLATVVETWGSAPRAPGALLAINQAGHRIGSVSGGCVEEDLAALVQAGAVTHLNVLTYGITEAQSRQVGLACGGTLKVMVEPLTHPDHIQPAVTALKQGHLITRRVNLTSGEVTWLETSKESPVYYDGHQFQVVYGPAWQLLIIGAGQISRYLAEFALALNYQVEVCDPRQEYLWPVAKVRRSYEMPDDRVKKTITPRSAVVALTHDPRLDDLALLEALNSPAFYVGALGSKTSSEKRRVRLQKLGITEQNLACLHAPVGLPINSRHPPEIAIAIAAEMTAVRYT